MKHPMRTKLVMASVALGLFASAANAATWLSGDFNVQAVNVTNLFGYQSKATMANFDAAWDKANGGTSTFGDANSVAVSDTFEYNGDFDFRVGAPQKATYSVADWLALGTGTVTGLDTSLGNEQLSFPLISNGTATTTFFLFTSKNNFAAADFTITHDDGVALFDDGVKLGGVDGPTSVRTTVINGFDGGTLSFLYAATNGNPSILEIDMTPTAVPLPAAAWMFGAALVGFVGMSRRKAKNAVAA